MGAGGGGANCRYDSSLGLLTKKFVSLVEEAPDGILDLNNAATSLQASCAQLDLEFENSFLGSSLLSLEGKLCTSGRKAFRPLSCKACSGSCAAMFLSIAHLPFVYAMTLMSIGHTLDDRLAALACVYEPGFIVMQSLKVSIPAQHHVSFLLHTVPNFKNASQFCC